MRRNVVNSITFSLLALALFTAWCSPLIASLPSHHPVAASFIDNAAHFIFWVAMVALIFGIRPELLKKRPRSRDLIEKRTPAGNLPTMFEFHSPEGNIINGDVQRWEYERALVCFSQPEGEIYLTWVEDIADGEDFACFSASKHGSHMPMPLDHYAPSTTFRSAVSA